VIVNWLVVNDAQKSPEPREAPAWRQGRFACREVDSEAGLLICGVYVDLNQIRAGEVLLPQEACYSSIGLRLEQPDESGSWLAPLSLSGDGLDDEPCASGRRASDKGLLPVSLEEYLRILTWTAQQVAAGGSPPTPDAIAQRLEETGLNPDAWLDAVAHFPGRFRRIVGSSRELVRRAAQAGRRWFHGVRQAARVFR
jgi:hypothetical protein